MKTIASSILRASVLILFVQLGISGAAHAVPTLSPSGGEITQTNQQFVISPGDLNVTQWWVYIGTGITNPSDQNIVNSGPLDPSTTMYQPTGVLPAGTVFFRLWYLEEGEEWQSIRATYTVIDGTTGGGQTLPTNASEDNIIFYNGDSWIAADPVVALNSKSPPSLGVMCAIALVGVFPSRSTLDPFIGQMIFVGFNFPPRGWAECNGQLLPIASYTALFSLLGTNYGGDGRTTFQLPDLRGRVPVHMGTGPGLNAVSIGQRFGSDSY